MEIRLERLRKEFGEVVAVDNLDIEVGSGSLVGLLGPSGCGKSTTLFMIAGLYRPSSGRILFRGEDISQLPPEKRGIGLVFQNYALYPHMTVLKNILFPLENQRIARPKAMAMAREMAEIVQIEDLLQRKPAQLSGGQQQRVAIARALVKKPRVLLFDEPLSNLDARLRLETREEIRRIQRETGITTIYVTHDQEEAMSITDEIVLMDRGILQQQDSPQRMYLEPTNRFVAKFLGSPPINILRGRIAGGQLILAGQPIGRANGLPDQEVDIGIRPESLEPMPAGGQSGLPAAINLIEVIGRDKILGLDLQGQGLRAIVSLETPCQTGQTTSFRIKPEGIFVFDPASGQRLGGVRT